MIKAKKGLLIGLFAAMMVFAFGATSVFAQSYDSKDASGHDAVCSGGVVSTIDWDTDGAKYADVEVTATDNTQKWFRFDYMKDEQITALKATKPSKDTHVFILRDWGETDLDTTSNGVVRANVRRMAYLTYDATTQTWEGGSSGYGMWISYESISAHPLWYFGTKAETVNIVDMSKQDIYFQGGERSYNPTSFNGGDYAAWLALKDTKNFETIYEKLDDESQAWTVGSAFTRNAQDGNYRALWTVSYGDYKAFSYDTATKLNKKVEITVTPNVDAIKAWIGGMNVGNNVILSTPAVFEWEANASNLGIASYEYWTDWAVDDRTSTPIEGYDASTYYDGADRAIAFANIGEAVTVKYAAFKLGDKLSSGEEVDLDTEAEDLADADWADSAAIKDGGKYMVFAKMSMDRYPNGTEAEGRLFLDEGSFEIVKFPIAMGFSQKTMNTEYGKYTKETLEAAVKNLFMYSNNAPDSKEDIAQSISKYGTVVGLFTDAGTGDLYAVVDENALRADTALSAVDTNYKFFYATNPSTAQKIGLGKVGVPNSTMELNIEKIANRVDFESVTKTYHVKKAKKLKKAKKFQLEASALYGDVKFAKTSGSTKVKVSKTGKVTVKKGTKKGTYKVKVKAYVNGTANYSAAAQTVAIYVKVKK